MNKLLMCPQGHRWDRPPLVSGGRVLCPECGLALSPTAAESESFTRPPPDTADPTHEGGSPTSAGPAERGRFRIIRLHAQGGLGQVSLARDEELGREVALKELRPELSDHASSRQRFVNEARITGQLEHPNIVPIYALGRDPTARPYYAMRFVRGRTLHEAIKHYRAEPAQAALRDLLRRFINVCHAVAYAHSQGVIHRDLKPSNVMLGDYGETLVVDWGIAKRTGESVPVPAGGPFEPGTGEPGLTAAAVPEITVAGQKLGTGAYMAPEQARDASAVGPAADVYSLGVMLGDIITPPSSSHSKPLRAHVAHVRPLAAVAARAQAPQVAARYATPAELAEEVERFLADEPVHAYDEPWTKRSARWARRHKPMVAAATALLVTALAAMSISNVLIARQRDATQAALHAEAEARAEATQHARTAEERLLASLMASGDAFSAAGRSQDARNVYTQAWNLARQLHVPDVAVIASLVRTNNEEPPALLGGDIGGFSGHASGIYHYEFSSDGRYVYTAGADGDIRQWDIRTGRCVRTFQGHTEHVLRLALSPDDRLLASYGWDHTLRLWDTRVGTEVAQIKMEPHDVFVRPLFSPDGKHILYYRNQGVLGLWEVPSGRLVREVALLTAEDLEREIFISSIAFDPDGRSLLVGRGRNLDVEETPRLVDLETGQEVRRFEGTRGNVYDLQFFPDGHSAVSRTRKHIVVWDVESGRELYALAAGEAEQIRILPDGKTFASGSHGGQIAFYEGASGERIRDVKRSAASHFNDYTVAPDGKVAVVRTLARREGLVLVDVGESAEVTTFLGHTGSTMAVAIAPDGHTAISGSWDGTLRRWDLATGRELAVMRGEGGQIWSVALSPDGRLAVAGSDGDNTLRLWDLDERREVRRWGGHQDIVTAVAFSPDGTTVASSSSDRTVRLWRAATGEQLHVFHGHSDKVRSVAFTPDRQSVLSGSFDGSVAAWDLSGGVLKSRYEVIPCSEADYGWRGGLAVSPDGRTALSVGYDGDMAVIDLARPGPVQAIPAHQAPAWAVSFFPDGKTAVSYSDDSSLTFWDVAARRSLGTIALPAGAGKCVAVSPDGTRVIVGGTSGALRLIDLSRPQRYQDFQPLLEHARQRLEVNPGDGRALATFGDWYAFRGRHDWAADFYEQARAGGADVSPLELARCYWKLERLADARREFASAIERNEAPAGYLRLCLDALSRTAAAE